MGGFLVSLCLWLRLSKASDNLFVLFRGSSAVEQWTVNPLVQGSNPCPGAMSDSVWRPRHCQSKSRHNCGGFLLFGDAWGSSRKVCPT